MAVKKEHKRTCNTCSAVVTYSETSFETAPKETRREFIVGSTHRIFTGFPMVSIACSVCGSYLSLESTERLSETLVAA